MKAEAQIKNVPTASGKKVELVQRRKIIFMKRLLYGSALLLAMSFVTGCAQHDPDSPDTSGAMPRNTPGVGVDTVGSGAAPVVTDTGTNQNMNAGDTMRQNNQ